MSNSLISFAVEVAAPVERAWEFWVNPEQITKWYFASDDWFVPFVENDLRVGSKFTIRMSAKDSSFVFDFEGTYTKIQHLSLIEYSIVDGRKVSIKFEQHGSSTRITETFEHEKTNTFQRQKSGWQAILNNFKILVES